MYKIERRFTLPIGHRLSKHTGRCASLHGHNFTILVGVKSKFLNKNDMVMDFSDLNAIVEGYIDKLDHCTILNVADSELGEILDKGGTRVILVSYDPTAERLAESIYKSIELTLEKMYPLVKMDYVIVYENEKSKATYLED